MPIVEQRLIGIMVSKSQNRIKVLKTYRPYVNDTDLLIAFTPKDIIWKQKEVTALMYSPADDEFLQIICPFPDVIYNRMFNKYRRLVQKIENEIGHGKCFNSINHFDKWKVHSILAKTELGKMLPVTKRFSITHLHAMAKKFNRLIIKPQYAAEGAGIYRIDLTESNEKKLYFDTLSPTHTFVNNHDLFTFLNDIVGRKKYLIQEEINLATVNNRKTEIRAMVQKNGEGLWNVTVIYCRIAHNNYFITNMYENLVLLKDLLDQLNIKPIRKYLMTNKVMKASIRAANALDGKLAVLGELSVDFALDDHKNVFIIEINGCPTKNSISELNDPHFIDSVFRTPIEYAQFVISSTRPPGNL